MLIAILLVGALTTLIYAVVFYVRHSKYWSRRGVPGPKSYPFVGNLWEAQNPENAWFSTLPRFTKKFGSVWGYQAGIYNILVVADPNVVHEVFLKRFDEFLSRQGNPLFNGQKADAPRVHLAEASGPRWKRIRTIVNPQFSTSQLRKILPTVEDSAIKIVEHLTEKSGESIDIHRFYQEYTMDVIARIAMGEPKSTQFGNDYVNIMKQIFENDPRNPFFIMAAGFPPSRHILAKIFRGIATLIGHPAVRLFGKIEKAVEDKKKKRAEASLSGSSENQFTDFIDLFLDAEADVDLAGESESNDMMHVSKTLTSDEVIAQCFVFLLAGFDTTANSLAYVSHFLAKYPEIQKRVQEEIDSICIDEKVTMDQLAELKYLDCVVKEGLRFHPLGAIATSRVAEHDCRVAGVDIEKGTIVLADAYYIQRDPLIWGEDADKFNPDRWFDVTKEQSQAFLTFGAGPRMCVGMRLAYIEEKLALVHILRNRDIVCVPETELYIAIYDFRSHIHHATYWKRRGVPGPKSYPFVGNLWEVQNPKNAWFSTLPVHTKKYGPLWGYQLGVRNVLVISDPTIVHEVFLKRFHEFRARQSSPFFAKKADAPRVHLVEASGPRWKRIRAIVTPQFSNSQLRKIIPTVEDSSKHLVEHLTKRNGEAINIHRFYQEYTMDVIARIAMGQPSSMQWESDYVDIVKKFFENDPRNGFLLLAAAFPPIRHFLFEIFQFMGRFIKHPAIELFGKIEKAVEAKKKDREQNGGKPQKEFTDFIDLFLDAEADIDLTDEPEKNDMLHISKKLTCDEVIAQCFVFLLAGFDTTANSLAYVSYFLAKYTEIQKRVQEEIDSICTPGESITLEELAELKYLDCVVKESLRHHPLATIAAGRVAEHDCQVAGVQIEKGTVIQANAYHIQHDPSIWGEDAAEFNPDRWWNVTKEQSQAFLSFGHGPRICVGMRLAYTEEKLALVHILRKFNIVRVPASEENLQLRGAFTVSPEAVTVAVRPRT